MSEQKSAKASFRDSKDRQWDLDINVGVIEDIEEQVQVKLDDMVENPSEFAKVLVMKPGKLVSIFYVICKDQIESLQMTERDFARLFDRDTLDKATNALIESMLTFSLRSSAGRTIRENLPQILEKMDRETESQLQGKMAKVLSDLHTNTPESAELKTPVPTP